VASKLNGKSRARLLRPILLLALYCLHAALLVILIIMQIVKRSRE